MIEFEPCAIGDSKTTKFDAFNRSSVETRFKWISYPPEFTVYPSEGVLGPQRREYFEIRFKPNKISNYKGLAECRFGSELEYSKTINLEAQCQFPQIMVKTGNKFGNKMTVDFGIVESGTSKGRFNFYKMAVFFVGVFTTGNFPYVKNVNFMLKTAFFGQNSPFRLTKTI